MTTLANLRTSAAPWLVLPAFVYMVLTAGSSRESVRDGVLAGELAAWAVVAIVPAVAAAASWEAGRHRRIADLRSVAARRPLRLWVWATVPVLALHLVLVAGALVIARSSAEVWPSGRGLLAVAHLVVLPFGWSAVGWSLGMLLPRAAAAPLAAVASWAWMAMTHAMGTPFLRHLGGFVMENSSLTDLVDPLAYLVPWLVVGGLAGAVGLLTGVRRRPVPAILAAALVAASTLVAGRSLVLDWGFSPRTEPRAMPTVCAGRAPAVCVPEAYGRVHAEKAREAALPALGALRSAGLPGPEVVRLASAALPPVRGSWPLLWSSDMPADQIAISVARSAVTGVAADAGVRDCRQSSVADAWASVVAGLDPREARDRMAPGDWAVVSEVRSRPAPEQARWFTETVRAQKHCVRSVAR
ncbi:hypothetical protein [Streptomyces sp. NPDC086023]|uniref:DUF7224 domain-containing protein n=1 Tax=Streptomyces sp. NPDC086023 TaxID=3365746 RepID=UPI0037D00369